MGETWYADNQGFESARIYREEEDMIEFLEEEAWQVFKEVNKIKEVTPKDVINYIEKG